MRHIWRQVYTVLCQAKKLFIIGTSLLETNQHLRHLPGAAIRSRHDLEVYVVNKMDGHNEWHLYRNKVEDTLGVRVKEYARQDFGSEECIQWRAQRS